MNTFLLNPVASIQYLVEPVCAEPLTKLDPTSAILDVRCSSILSQRYEQPLVM